MDHHNHKRFSRTHCLARRSALDLLGKTNMEMESDLPFTVPHGRRVSGIFVLTQEQYHARLANSISALDSTIALSVLRFVYLKKRLDLYQKSEEKGFEDGNFGIIAVMLSVLEANVAIVCGMSFLYRLTKISADRLFSMTACLPTLRYYSWYTWWSARYCTFQEWLWKDKDGNDSGRELRSQTVGPPKPKDVESGQTPKPPYSPQLNDVHQSPGELMAEPIHSPALPFIPRLPSAERNETDIEMNDLQDVYVAYTNEMPYRDV